MIRLETFTYQLFLTIAVNFRDDARQSGDHPPRRGLRHPEVVLVDELGSRLDPLLHRLNLPLQPPLALAAAPRPGPRDPAGGKLGAERGLGREGVPRAAVRLEEEPGEVLLQDGGLLLPIRVYDAQLALL